MVGVPRFAWLLVTVVVALLAAVPTALAHHPGAPGSFKSQAFGASRAAVADPFVDGQPADPAAAAAAKATPGPCTEEGAAGMPEGGGHDHFKAEEHFTLGCKLEQVATLGLNAEIQKAFGRRDVVLGEMDVKADIAAVSVAFPTAGIIFFDVKDPTAPRFLSIYKGRACDEQPIDIDCGAFVDLSADGKLAFLAVQNLTSIPQQPEPPGTPGVEVVSIAAPVGSPTSPQLVDVYTSSAGLTGVHTSRSHVIPTAKDAGAPAGEKGRTPGEFLFSNRNAIGVDIARVERPGGVAKIVPLATIRSGGLHDVFIQNDPIDKRTYIYLADGFQTGFKVFDVTDAMNPVALGDWDITPECANDFYSHTIDVKVTASGKRFVTLPTEGFFNGDTSEEDQKEGCGKVQGAGDRAIPMWIVDATDFSALARNADTDPVEKEKSLKALVATWINPAGRAAGNLTFSPHNQQIVGDKIYLSNYHGGVYVLDASKAFDDTREPPAAERPTEIAFKVPEVKEPRPIIGLIVNPVMPFFTSFPLGRPEVWDMVFYEGSSGKSAIVTQDMSGGVYALKETVKESGAGIDAPIATRKFFISRRLVRADRRGRIKVVVACRSAAPCVGTLRLRSKGTRGRRRTTFGLVRTAFTAAPGRSKLTFRLTRLGLRRLRRVRETRLTAFANLPRDAIGNGPTTRTGSFRLRRPRPVRRSARR